MVEEEKEGKEEEKVDLSYITTHILNYIRSDKLAIVIFILALLICAYTIYTVDKYQAKINDHWVQQFKDLNCVCSSVVISFNESPRLPLLNIEIPVKND